MPDIGDHEYRDVTPRCPICGRFAELVDDEDTTLLYACCNGDFEKTVPKPNRVDPTFRRRWL